MGTGEKVVKAFESCLKKTDQPLVIDADGLNILSKKKSLIKSARYIIPIYFGFVGKIETCFQY